MSYRGRVTRENPTTPIQLGAWLSLRDLEEVAHRGVVVLGVEVGVQVVG